MTALAGSIAREAATRAWRITARAEQGPRRGTMQDALAILPGARCGWGACDVVAVFDGVGGMPYGAQAAEAAATGLPDALAAARSPQDALIRLQPVVQATRGATTAALAALAGDGLVRIAWCGDSNVYALDGQGGLLPLTRADQERGLLTQCLGLDGAKPHATEAHLGPGQAVLLCTDGVDGVVGRLPLQRVLEGPGDQALVGSLLAAVAAAGAPDNATVVLARRSLGGSAL